MFFTSVTKIAYIVVMFTITMPKLVLKKILDKS